MDGIFVAYHNTKRLFGFQYLPMFVLRPADQVLSAEGRLGRKSTNGYLGLVRWVIKLSTSLSHFSRL